MKRKTELFILSFPLLIRVDEEIKRKVQQLARAEQKSVTQKIREILYQYVEDHDIEKSLKSLWKEIGEEMKKAGYKPSDVDRIVREARSEK